MRAKGRTLLAVAVAIAALCVACTLSGCAVSSQNEEDSHEQGLQQIKIGADVLEPFFYMGRAGEYVGIDADIAREACRRAGLDPVFVSVAWTERDEKLEDGTIDCIWSAFAINGREGSYDWTEPYLDTALAMAVDERCPSTSLEDFQGPGGAAVRTNSIAEQFFLNGASMTNACEVPLHSYGSADMAKTAFVKSYADAWVSYKIVLDEFMSENPGLYRYLEDDLVDLHLGVAFPKDCGDERFSALDDALASMRRDGTIDQIVQRYIDGPGDEGNGDEGK